MRTINRKWILWNLREATDEIQRTIAELETDPDYDEPELRVRLREVYNHLNTAWNARHVSDETAQAASADDFDRWWMMPDDVIY